MIKITMINIKNDINIYYNFGHSKIFYFIFLYFFIFYFCILDPKKIFGIEFKIF